MPKLLIGLHRTVTKPPLPYPGEDAAKEAARISALPDHESQTWMLLEYCDKPSLQVTSLGFRKSRRNTVISLPID